MIIEYKAVTASVYITDLFYLTLYFLYIYIDLFRKITVTISC